jgi:membrane-associated phospholipid phosphatase
MIPATYLHGGHYIVDLLGGVVLFISSTLIVDRLFKLKFIRNRCCDNFSR